MNKFLYNKFDYRSSLQNGIILNNEMIESVLKYIYRQIKAEIYY